MASPESPQPPPGGRRFVGNPDYDLEATIDTSTGLRQGLTAYGDPHFSLFLRKVFIKAAGYGEDALSRPIIGIVNTYSSFNPCHANIPQLIEAVKRGVQLSGGLAIDFPTISLHESFSTPTSMFLRNLMSMDTEEMIRAQPCDAVVLIGGCDKTTVAQLMGGISANKPIIHLVTGPMMPGSHKGVRIGACTDCRSNWALYRADKIDIEDITAINEELAPTAGTCGVMGTASTMACLLAGLGMMQISSSAAPAVSATRLRIAEEAGRLAVAALQDRNNMRPQTLLTRESFLNAITVLQAIGGSTNAVVHLMAIVNRHPALAGKITLDTIDEVGRKTPLLVDLKPSGQNYMTDFHNSGGMPALLRQLRPLLHLNARTITGRTLGEEIDRTTISLVPRELSVIHDLHAPLYPASSLIILRGNLAPGGCVMKASASKDRRLLKHAGRAVVFKNSADLAKRIDDPNLDVTADDVLVLQNIGPVGNPGMPEAGMIPIPRKLSSQGVQDMLRLSDGRMSGTAGGTIVLHISPEAANPQSVLGILQDGDNITCDYDTRAINVDLSEDEIRKRITERVETIKTSNAPWVQRDSERGYRGLYMMTVNQADSGADLEFLKAAPTKHVQW